MEDTIIVSIEPNEDRESSSFTSSRSITVSWPPTPTPIPQPLPPASIMGPPAKKARKQRVYLTDEENLLCI